jgi:DNA-binding LytR/AlgR family response regulator
MHFQQVNIQSLINPPNTKLKNRIIGKKGTEFFALQMNEIAYFFTEHKIVFVKDFSGKQLILDKTLAEVESMLDKNKFFRINRKFIVHLKAIERFKPDHGKIRVFLKPGLTEEIHVSKETAPGFRNWIEQ